MPVRLINTYPKLTEELAGFVGVVVSSHDHVVASPVIHEMKGSSPVENDVTVRMLANGKPTFFAQVEVQQEYDLGKLATLRAYHGSEVRNSHCGGVMIVLSPRREVAERFRQAEREWQETFAFKVAYLSGEDLAPFAAPERSFPERALAAALTDFSKDFPEGTMEMLAEMDKTDKTLGELFMAAIVKEPYGARRLEEEMTPDLLERLKAMPSFKAWWDESHSEGEAEGEARARREALLGYFQVRHDTLSSRAEEEIRACTDPTLLKQWLDRAFAGETSAEIFGTR